jgi:hypothetical protein
MGLGHDNWGRIPHSLGNDGTSRGAGAWTPAVRPQDIFRQLLEDEVRKGRLTRLRRHRIVRFGARMGLSAVEIGELVTKVRAQRAIELEELRDQAKRSNPLPLPIEPPASHRRYLPGIMAITGGLILLLSWFSMRL